MAKKKKRIVIWAGAVLLAAALALTIYNVVLERRAVASIDHGIETVNEAISASAPTLRASRNIRDLPGAEADGVSYAGALVFPTLNELTLPVQAEWSQDSVRLTPCIFSGTPYGGDLVITASNYRNLFGRISDLKQGDEVRFYDVEGAIFSYEVGAVETMDVSARENMDTEQWDLTLFTVTWRGLKRVVAVVRCILS